MRRFIIIAALFIFAFVIVVPALIVSNFNIFSPKVKVEESQEMEITVYFHETGETKVISIEDYLVGVVAAEMPADFEVEALKAQAVAARTYTLKKTQFKS